MIQALGWCPSHFCVKWDVLCKHEYRVDGKLYLEKVAQRWLNRTTYESHILPTGQNVATGGVLPVPEQDGWHGMGFTQPQPELDVGEVNTTTDVENNSIPIDVDKENNLMGCEFGTIQGILILNWKVLIWRLKSMVILPIRASKQTVKKCVGM